VFLGREIGEQRNYSEEVARAIDEEVRNLINQAHETALRTLRENKDKLIGLARKLMEVETLEGAELQAMFA